MRYLPAVLLAFSQLFASAADAGVGDQTPVVSEVVRGDYQRLADCVYERIEQADTQMLKYNLAKSDLPSAKKTKITQSASYVRFWEATFSAAGPQSTNLEVSVTTSLWGPNRGWLDTIMPHVAACSAHEHDPQTQAAKTTPAKSAPQKRKPKPTAKD